MRLALAARVTSTPSMWRTAFSFLTGLVLALGVAWLLHTGLARASATRAEGTISQIRHDVTDTGRVWWPYFVFHDTQGRSHEVKFSVAIATEDAYVVGQKVPVLYRADAPENAVIDEPIQLWLKPALVVIVGLVGVWILCIAARGRSL